MNVHNFKKNNIYNKNNNYNNQYNSNQYNNNQISINNNYKNPENLNINNSDKNNNITNNDTNNSSQNSNYLFSTKGFKNLGSNYNLNSILQCLLHINELIVYFLNEYPNDCQTLLQKNKGIQSKGDISRAFYNLVIEIYNFGKSESPTKFLNTKTTIGIRRRGFPIEEFKRKIRVYNPQFKNFEANDSKDLILYLLQTMHEELNFYVDKNNLNIE